MFKGQLDRHEQCIPRKASINEEASSPTHAIATEIYGG